MKIHIISSDPILTEVLARYLKKFVTKQKLTVSTFPDVISAISSLEKNIPDLIFLDFLLDGPDGFTYLNEIASYSDTNKIPIVLISSLYHELPKMSSYSVIAYLDKTTFTPDDIQKVIDGIIKVKHD